MEGMAASENLAPFFDEVRNPTWEDVALAQRVAFDDGYNKGYKTGKQHAIQLLEDKGWGPLPVTKGKGKEAKGKEGEGKGEKGQFPLGPAPATPRCPLPTQPQPFPPPMPPAPPTVRPVGQQSLPVPNQGVRGAVFSAGNHPTEKDPIPPSAPVEKAAPKVPMLICSCSATAGKAAVQNPGNVASGKRAGSHEQGPKKDGGTRAGPGRG